MTGLTPEDIAELEAMPKAAGGQRAHEWSSADDAKLQMGIELGVRQDVLAKKLGVCINTMRKRAREKGWLR